MKFLSYIFVFFTLLYFSKQNFAQGCSDAGVCSVGSLGIAQYKYQKLPLDKTELELIQEVDGGESNSMNSTIKPTTQKDTLVKRNVPYSDINYNLDSLRNNNNLIGQQFSKGPKYVLLYSESFGVGDESTAIITSQLEANVTLVQKKLYTQVKLPYVYTSGNLGSTNGLGDITWSLSYTAINKKKTNLSVVGGIKIPTGNADFAKGNKPLPMVYQASLGSTDALFGFNYRYSKWDFTVGYQHSFNANKNGYLHSSTADKTYNSYFESKNIKRADDVVFRTNRSFVIKKSTISTGLLFIYHLQNDNYTDSLGIRGTLKGSQGLTLNFNFSALMPLSKNIDFVFIFANPIKTRESRPDGLTREFIVMGGLRFSVF